MAARLIFERQIGGLTVRAYSTGTLQIAGDGEDSIFIPYPDVSAFVESVEKAESAIALEKGVKRDPGHS